MRHPLARALAGSSMDATDVAARHDIGILAYSALFLAEDATLQTVLRDQASRRGAEEGIHDLMAARIRNALILFRALADEPGAELRLHDTALYTSIYRADAEILANHHVYGFPASHAPVLHLHHDRDGSIASRYLEAFEQVWATARRP